MLKRVGAALALVLAAALVFYSCRSDIAVAESVYSDVYSPSPESVPEVVYQIPDVMVQNPTPFYIRGKGAVEAIITSSTPVELILISVENVPDTVSLAVYSEGKEVAAVQGNQVIYAPPFMVQGVQLLEIQLSGRGRLENSKLHFSTR